jgi:predicted RNA-binding protein YlxR (DUF448 family)
MTPAKRHVPLRTCIVCGAKGPKRDFTRIVSTPEDGVKVDRTGRLSGRGAYVCGEANCSPAELRRGRIEHAFRRGITDEDWKAVTEEIAAGQAQRY